ncbi:MAG: hypothetical protein ACM357_00755 [Gemmatimonadota bacterium]
MTQPAERPEAATAPSTGTADPSESELQPDEEPRTTGTLFLTTLILMLIGAVWIVMYSLLLRR